MDRFIWGVREERGRLRRYFGKDEGP